MGGNQVAKNILKSCKGLQSRSATSPIVLMILGHREAISNRYPVQSIESSSHPFKMAEITSCGNVLWLAEIDLVHQVVVRHHSYRNSLCIGLVPYGLFMRFRLPEFCKPLSINYVSSTLFTKTPSAPWTCVDRDRLPHNHLLLIVPRYARDKRLPEYSSFSFPSPLKSYNESRVHIPHTPWSKSLISSILISLIIVLVHRNKT